MVELAIINSEEMHKTILGNKAYARKPSVGYYSLVISFYSHDKVNTTFSFN